MQDCHFNHCTDQYGVPANGGALVLTVLWVFLWGGEVNLIYL